MNLLETLTKECALEYISQLKFTDKWKSVVSAMIEAHTTSTFTMAEWNNAIIYLSINKHHDTFKTTEDAAKFLINMK